MRKLSRLSRLSLLSRLSWLSGLSGLSLLSLLLCLSSCRRDLEVYSSPPVRLRIDVDWLSKVGAKPNGMTLGHYDPNPLERQWSTNDVESQTLFLDPGTHRLLITSNSPGEYESLNFTSETDFDSAAVYSRPNETRVTPSWTDSIRYMAPAPSIASATDSFAVTADMLEEKLRFADYRKRVANDDTVYIVRKEVPEPLATTVYVQIRVGGFDNAKACEAALIGMADGCYLSQIWRTKTTGNLSLTGWKALQTRATNGDGWIYTETTTWGLPDGLEQESARDSTDLKLVMMFTLSDGSKRFFSYNVGYKVEYVGGISNPATRDDVRKRIRIIVDVPDYPRLPDVPDNAGFDAEVQPWEEGDIIDLGRF